MFSGYYVGDINQDSSINTADIVVAVNYIIDSDSLSELELQLADCNGDFIVNIFDLLLIVEYIFNQ